MPIQTHRPRRQGDRPPGGEGGAGAEGGRPPRHERSERPPRRERLARPAPEARPKAKRLKPARKHRNEVLDALPADLLLAWGEHDVTADPVTVLASLAKTNRLIVAEEGWPVCSIASIRSSRNDRTSFADSQCASRNHEPDDTTSAYGSTVRSDASGFDPPR